MSKSLKSNLRNAREKKYAKEVHKVSFISKGVAMQILRHGIRGVVLPIPEKSTRAAKFKLFVEQNFKMLLDPFESSSGWPKNFRKIQPYQTWKEYAMTDYGAMMIAHVLRDNKTSRVRFQVSLGSSTAEGDTNLISFPEDFGTKGVGGYVNRFGGDGQPIDYLAIIHHEFRHTKFWGKLPDVKPTLADERDAVNFNENPVRIINNFEPRYCYYSNIYGATINVFGGKPKNGKWGVQAADPSKFAKRGSPEALK